MTASNAGPLSSTSHVICRDLIERFMDRSWLLDRSPARVLHGHRSALQLLDDWMQRHRRNTLAGASTSDVRALLDSRQWDALSQRCEGLLGLLTRFYRSLADCKFRCDDPLETLIDQELAAAARKRTACVTRARELPVRVLSLSRQPVA